MAVETRRRLEQIAAEVRAENPSQEIVVADGAVWLRRDGHDYGLYSALIHGPEIVCCVREGQTVLHRPALRRPAFSVRG